MLLTRDLCFRLEIPRNPACRRGGALQPPKPLVLGNLRKLGAFTFQICEPLEKIENKRSELVESFTEERSYGL